MKRLRKVVSGILCSCLLSTSLYASENFVETKEPSKKMVMSLLTMVDKRYSLLSRQVDKRLIEETGKAREDFSLKQLDSDIAGIKSGAITVEGYIDEISKKNLVEAAAQKEEMQHYVRELLDRELSELGEVLSDNPHYVELALELDTAFTRSEKQRVITEALFRDFDHLVTMTQKKISRMSKDDLLANLEKTRERLNASEDKATNKKTIIKILAIAGTAILVGGIVAWSKYHGNYTDAKNEREGKLTDLRNRLESEFQTLSQAMKEEEMQYLQNNGFQLMQCGSYQRPDSIICSRYDYGLFSGTKYCTVHCWKNATTGQETLHQSPVCTSPFIPTDCDDPAEYGRGYDAGYDIGYDFGRDDGDEDGWYDGSYDGLEDGDEYGFEDGFDFGYSDGFSDGYWDGSFKSDIKNKGPGYERGFLSGKRDAEIFKRNYLLN
jgi:hypothetical protein